MQLNAMQAGFNKQPKQISKKLQQTKYIAKSFFVWFINQYERFSYRLITFGKKGKGRVY